MRYVIKFANSYRLTIIQRLTFRKVLLMEFQVFEHTNHLAFRAKYSRMNQVKFVEDNL